VETNRDQICVRHGGQYVKQKQHRHISEADQTQCFVQVSNDQDNRYQRCIAHEANEEEGEAVEEAHGRDQVQKLLQSVLLLLHKGHNKGTE